MRGTQLRRRIVAERHTRRGDATRRPTAFIAVAADRKAESVIDVAAGRDVVEKGVAAASGAHLK